MSGLPIPSPGDVSAQVSQGNTLNSLAAGQPLGSPSTSALLNAGLTLASSLGSGQIARVATDAIGGASSGFALGGPYGAVAGAIVGTLEGLLTLGPSYQGLVVIDDTEGIDHLYKVLVQWNGTNIGTGPRSGEPLGWNFWDYMARARPPRSTPRPALLRALLQALAAEQDTQWPGAGVGSVTGWASAYWTSSGFQQVESLGGPSLPHLATVGPAGPSPVPWTAAQVAGAVEPLASPLVWLWGQPEQVQDVVLNEWYAWATPTAMQGAAGAGAPPPAESTLYEDALANVVPPPGKSQAQTLRRAILLAPDPLYWAADLYAQQVHGATTIFNTAALVGLATWSGMILNGASPRAIATELLLQRGTIAESGPVPSLFQSLVDDALSMAALADAGHRTFPGWGAIGSPLLPASPGPPSTPHRAAQSPALRAARATVDRFVRMYLDS
jgi:hypothetical protein